MLHTTATQSGAMTVAFMNGTPVIARNISAFSQFIIHWENSYLVPKDCSVSDLLEAMQYVENNQDSLSVAARKLLNRHLVRKTGNKTIYGCLIL